MKYAYKIAEINVRDAEKNLNGFGADGWEISSVMEINPSLLRVILRRPIAGDIKMIGID